MNKELANKIISNGEYTTLLTDKKAIRENFVFYEECEKIYHKTFDKIDRKLKLDDDLNTTINKLTEVSDILNFDIKEHFVGLQENPYTNSYINFFDEERYNKMKDHCENWFKRKEEILKEIKELEGKKLFKVIFQNKIEKLKNKVRYGDDLYNRYSPIFNLYERHQNMDKVAVQSEYDKLYTEVTTKINEVMDFHIAEMVNNHHEMLFFKEFRRQKFTIYSPAFLSSEHNKNLSKYFNDKVLMNRLNYHYEEFKKICNESQKEDEQPSQPGQPGVE